MVGKGEIPISLEEVVLKEMGENKQDSGFVEFYLSGEVMNVGN